MLKLFFAVGAACWLFLAGMALFTDYEFMRWVIAAACVNSAVYLLSD